MKAINLLLYLLCIVGALVGYFFLAPPLSWCAVAACAAFAVWMSLASERASATVLRFAGLSWSMEDFVRGWLITGRTGSGKTQCAINTITYQVFQNVPNWGGICLDQKGLYWEILVKMAEHFSRERDLVLLQTRPTRSHHQHYRKPRRSRFHVCQGHCGHRGLPYRRARSKPLLSD